MADACSEEKCPQELAESLVQHFWAAQHLNQLFQDWVLAALPCLHVKECRSLPPRVIHHISSALFLGNILVQQWTHGFTKDARIQLPYLSFYACWRIVIQLFFFGYLQQIPVGSYVLPSQWNRPLGTQRKYHHHGRPIILPPTVPVFDWRQRVQQRHDNSP